MFQIISLNQLTAVALILCILLLLGSVFNMAAPYVSAAAKEKVRLPIIMYHQISENPAVLGDYAIPLSLLEQDFQYLKDKGYNPVSFTQLKNYTEGGISLPENPVIITFDDGQRTFLTQVLPLMEKYSFPANVNVIGSLVKLYTENGETNDKYAYLNEDDILTLSRHNLVELGCHSYSLHSLSIRRGMGKLQGETQAAYEKVITEDLTAFSQYFKEITGQSTCILAYPYGIKNSQSEELAKNFGFTVTLTCREAVNEIAQGDNNLDLGRFNRPYKESTESFFNRILRN